MTTLTQLEAAAAATVTLPDRMERIVLMGFMGAGKSTVGRLLADELGWSFLDLDAAIETRAGLSVPQIFATRGEAHFRRLESSALAAALGRAKIVIALGGGTPELLTNRLLLEQTPGTFPVFLNAPFETLYDRCFLQGPANPVEARPVLANPDLARSRFLERQPSYRRLARLTLDTSDLNPRQTLSLLMNSLAVIQ